MLSLMRLSVTGLALSLAVAPIASAVVNPVMDFGTGYACEGTRAANDNETNPGDSLVIVGHVAMFNDPFDDLDANDPNKEYTYVYESLTSVVTVPVDVGIGWVYTTTYTGGVLRVYCDPSQDADYANKATFANGDMILEATLENFQIVTNTLAPTGCGGNQNADVTGYTGGSLVDRLSGFDCGIITGAFSVCSPETVPANIAALGYFGWSDTKLDVDCPVPTENTTWGSLKSLYSN